MKTLWKRLCRRPAAVLYGLGAAGLVLYMLANFALDSILYTAGVLREQTVTLADAALYQLVDLEQTGLDTLTSRTGDAQLLLTPGQPVRRLRLVAEYGAGSHERDLYYHLPGGGYSARLRVWPVRTADGAGWVYTVPRWAGQNVRLDLVDTAPVTVRVTAIVLNERLPWYRYFIPAPWQLFWLAVLPGLLACAVTLRRPGKNP